MPIRGGLAGATSKVGCFTEAAGGGDWKDINAPRNGPLRDPISYMSLVVWHTEFDQFELATPNPVDVTIGHTALAPEITNIGIGTLFIPASSGARQTDILLYAHGLGYKPRVKVVISGRAINPGQTIQVSGSYRRSVSVFVNTYGVYLREQAWAKDATLPAMSQTYRLFIFRQATTVPGYPPFGEVGGVVTIGKGIIRSDRKYLRRTGVGDQEFSMDSGPTMDISNGAKCVANGGTLTAEPGYDGGLSAPSYVLVGL